MFGFGRSNKVKHLGELGLSDPLEAIATPEEGVEAKADDQGLLQIRRRFTPKGRLYGWIAGRFGYRHEVRVNLDERGSFFWRLMDGRRSLFEIAAELAIRYDLPAGEAREAVIVFVKMLMIRRLIFLAVPQGATPQDRKV